jgi:hypothetical protein
MFGAGAGGNDEVMRGMESVDHLGIFLKGSGGINKQINIYAGKAAGLVRLQMSAFPRSNRTFTMLIPI